MAEEFISLRDFLLLKEPYLNYERSLFSISTSAEKFVELYDKAKYTWETYREPPTGCKVRYIYTGRVGIFQGDYTRDDRYYAFSHPSDESFSPERTLCVEWRGCFLLPKVCWWALAEVVEE